MSAQDSFVSFTANLGKFLIFFIVLLAGLIGPFMLPVWAVSRFRQGNMWTIITSCLVLLALTPVLMVLGTLSVFLFLFLIQSILSWAINFDLKDEQIYLITYYSFYLCYMTGFVSGIVYPVFTFPENTAAQEKSGFFIRTAVFFILLLIVINLKIIPVGDNQFVKYSALFSKHQEVISDVVADSLTKQQKFDFRGVYLIHGELTKKQFYGPPGFGKDPSADQQVEAYIVHLRKSIKVVNDNPADENNTTTETIKVQLVFHQPVKDIKQFIKKDVKVRGTFFSSKTGYHLTLLLMDVERIQLVE